MKCVLRYAVMCNLFPYRLVVSVTRSGSEAIAVCRGCDLRVSSLNSAIILTRSEA